MHVHLYTGSLSIVQKSGVGQAILHQKEMLSQVGIGTTTRWSEKAEIIHINTILPDSPFAVLAARIQGKKVVYYGHSTMEDFRNSFKCSNFFAPLFRHWIKFCYSLSDVILTPTEYSKKLLLGYGIRKPIYSISNGVDTDFFTFDEEWRKAFREKYGLQTNEKAIISVGHYIERKGILDFIELARRVPNVRFFWFGYTSPTLVPQNIYKAIASAPSNLVFPGYVKREDLRDAYCGCDAFAFMTKEETEGIVVLEALSCGIPTVVRDIPVYEDWLQNGEQVYKANDIADFKEKIIGILDGTLPPLTKSGKQLALEHSMAVIGAKLKDIYKQEKILY